jgi:hypothetical protein
MPLAPLAPLAVPSDVEDVWRPLTDAEKPRVLNLIAKASSKLRQKCPFDIDDRIGLFTSATDPEQLDVTALDPQIVADVVATIVKRFLVNQDGVASQSQGAGPFSKSATYVNRYDKTGSDVRGAIQVIDSDIEQLRPAVPAQTATSFEVGIPDPRVLVPRGGYSGQGRIGIGLPAVILPDIAPGTGNE